MATNTAMRKTQELYTRKDGQPVPVSQISARVKSYPQLFKVNSDDNPLTITLNQ